MKTRGRIRVREAEAADRSRDHRRTARVGLPALPRHERQQRGGSPDSTPATFYRTRLLQALPPSPLRTLLLRPTNRILDALLQLLTPLLGKVSNTRPVRQFHHIFWVSVVREGGHGLRGHGRRVNDSEEGERGRCTGEGGWGRRRRRRGELVERLPGKEEGVGVWGVGVEIDDEEAVVASSEVEVNHVCGRRWRISMLRERERIAESYMTGWGRRLGSRP